MLQQILDDMYIDPEVLAELSEEQTQVLYYKMREEQIRRYMEWSEREEKKPQSPSKKKSHKKINWKHGADGDIWVWVMGDHRNDRPYEELLENSRRLEANRLAEEELRIQRQQQEEQEKKLRAEEEAKRKRLKEEEDRLAKVRRDLEQKRRKAEEAAIYASLKEANLAKEQEKRLEQQRREAERKGKELREKEIALKAAREKRANEYAKSQEDLKRQVSQRTEDLYMSASEVRADQVRMAENEKDKVEQIWQVQLRKIKLADKERARVAKRARDEVRKSRCNSQDMDGLKLDELLKKNAKINKTSSNASLSKKPTCRADVISWYKNDQFPKGAGIKKGSKIPEVWFHGCINRTEAGTLLKDKRSGSFLVRLSEKVWGYALSYKDDSRVKHFLIDATGVNYQFFGTDQISHTSLGELVKYHKERPITFTGQEILTDSCGQSTSPPDYQELM
ncbi:SH2 domain-containing protein 4B-like [Apostichopus japonicus]|uniref:SH2 domain-containing protein 4B-like n=1 Tax=Stichopus japonicus TaxID=307972 RepID=UPI003AB80102